MNLFLGKLVYFLQSRKNKPEILVALAKTQGKAAVPFLIKALKSGDEDIHFTAVKLLGEVGDPAATAPLIEQLSAPRFARSVVRAMGEIADPSAVPALAALMTRCLYDRNFCRSASERTKAVEEISFALSRMGEAGFPPLVKVLQYMISQFAEHYTAVCLAMIRADRKAATRILLDLAQDRSCCFSARVDAMRLLPECEVDQSLVQSILEIWKNSVRYDGWQLHASFPEPRDFQRACEQSLHKCAKDVAERFSASIEDGSFYAGQEWSVEDVSRLIARDDAKAIDYFARTRDLRAITPLCARIRERSQYRPTAELVRQLGRFSDRNVVPLLWELVTGDGVDAEVRAWAESSLVSLGDSKGLGKLMSGMRSILCTEPLTDFPWYRVQAVEYQLKQSPHMFAEEDLQFLSCVQDQAYVSYGDEYVPRHGVRTFESLRNAARHALAMRKGVAQ